MKQYGVFYRIILIFLLVSLLLTGCQHKKERIYESGSFSYTNRAGPMMMGVKSTTDTFSLQDVTIDLYYATYDCTPKQSCYERPWSHYGIIDSENIDNLHLALYFVDGEHLFEIPIGTAVSSYTEIPNHYFIKEVPIDQAFTESYRYDMHLLSGIHYKHSEKLTIPPSVFTSHRGCFAIAFYGLYYDAETGQYIVSVPMEISFDYSMQNDDTVILEFETIRE